MIAQRRRNNHPATVWTHSPRVNYSRIIPEVGMVMKKASRMISPLRQGDEKSFRSRRSRDDGGGGYRLFRGDLIRCLGFWHHESFIGKEARKGGTRGGHTWWRRALVWARATLGCGGLVALLRSPFGLYVPLGEILNLAFVPSNSENISLLG